MIGILLCEGRHCRFSLLIRIFIQILSPDRLDKTLPELSEGR